MHGIPGIPYQVTKAREWIPLLDGLALQANADLELAARQQHQAGEPGPVVADALVAIASQLAYGNALAAANFYMAHRLWITTNEEKP